MEGEGEVEGMRGRWVSLTGYDPGINTRVGLFKFWAYVRLGQILRRVGLGLVWISKKGSVCICYFTRTNYAIFWFLRAENVNIPK